MDGAVVICRRDPRLFEFSQLVGFLVLAGAAVNGGAFIPVLITCGGLVEVGLVLTLDEVAAVGFDLLETFDQRAMGLARLPMLVAVFDGLLFGSDQIREPVLGGEANTCNLSNGLNGLGQSSLGRQHVLDLNRQVEGFFVGTRG
jgi:hypothetical protein